MDQHDTTRQDADATQAFLDALPELKPGERFCFACHPGVPCFNACCSDLALMLTPYDVLRLRQRLGLSSRDFISRHVQAAQAQDTGFPMLRLLMREDVPGAPCPFVTREGCSVYPDRPGACRTYPLGRATKTGAAGEVVEQFFVVREPHCRGFEAPGQWTSAQWLTDQDLAGYNRLNDMYMLLLAETQKRGVRLSPKQSNMVYLAVFNTDAFRDFLSSTGMLDRLQLSPEDKQAILACDKRRLEFAMDWLKLALFGLEDGVRRTP